MSSTPTPFLIVGDLPGQRTGLSRICGDLVRQIHAAYATTLDVRVCGYAPWLDLPRTGAALDASTVLGLSCPAWVFSNLTAWGREAVHTAYRHWFGARPGIVLTVWDAGRCYDIRTESDLPVQWWGYIAVDGENMNGKISGPALAVLRQYTRVLPYTAYGYQVLRHSGLTVSPPLPHGIDGATFTAPVPQATFQEVVQRFGTAIGPKPYHLIGTVATNQRRKDWGAVALTLKGLRAQGYNVYGWWHTDRPVSEAWSLPQLIEDAGLTGRVFVTQDLTDVELAVHYFLCRVTIAPGRGEGFGYPIVESLAIGTPVLHVGYGGGAELIGDGFYTPLPTGYTLDGPYGIMRPVMPWWSWVGRARQLCQEAEHNENDQALFWRACRDRGAAYHWSAIWPRWQQWIEEGL